MPNVRIFVREFSAHHSGTDFFIDNFHFRNSRKLFGITEELMNW